MANKPNAKAKVKEQLASGVDRSESATKKSTNFKRLSEYGKQLHEKQKLKEMYGMREKQFQRFYDKANRMSGVPGENLLSLLERRLDSVLYRLKLAVTCSQARQMIVHGHVLVNGKRVTSPSYLTQLGDVVSLHASVLEKTAFLTQAIDKRLNIAIKVPEWLELVKQDRKGKVLRYPVRTDIQYPVEEHLIVALYSK